jgi:hemerythrin-like domain-containing protein
MKGLVDFYPGHIEKEDRRFFIPCMAYFSSREQDDMLEAFREFDRRLIHEKYRSVVEKFEGKG